MQTFNTSAKFLLAGVLVFTSLFARPDTSPGMTKRTGDTEKTIRDYFRFPAVLIARSGEHKINSQKVEVLFSTSKDGKVNFVFARTTNADLRAEIEKQFYALRLSALKENVVHSVVLNFRTI